jgi:hypothetical protein
LHAERTPTFYDDERGWLAPVEAAKLWLARQLQYCPVRLDRIQRSALFEEVEAAVKSVDHMIYHKQAIHDSNHWCSYEVFLKAA